MTNPSRGKIILMRKKIAALFLILALSIYVYGCSSNSGNSSSSGSGGSCCSCGGCSSCCGGNDGSTDKNNDGSQSNEQIPTNLGDTQQAATQNTVPVSVCDNVNANLVMVSATKSAMTTGYDYQYTYDIKACASSLGFMIYFDDGANGKNSQPASEGSVAYIGKETQNSADLTSIYNYDRVCIRTSGNPSEQCAAIGLGSSASNPGTTSASDNGTTGSTDASGITQPQNNMGTSP